MPIPKPNQDEKQDDFIKRCMSDTTMNKDYEEEQRTAICQTSWDDNQKSSKKASVPGSYNDLQERINTKIRDNQIGRADIWIQDIIPDKPIGTGNAIVQDFEAGKIYEIPFNDQDNEIVLGDAIEVERKTSYEAIKFARAEGSYEELKEMIKSAIRKGLNPNQYAYIPATYPDRVVARVSTEDPVTYAYSEQLFEYPYTIDDDGNITLGEPTQVREVKTFEAVKIGNFVNKDDTKKEITGPVMIPGCPDCDFKRGEKIFTEDEVAEFCRKYNADFRLADQMHVYGATGEVIGEAVENWTLKEDLTTENVDGETVTLPKGTWMATIKVTDDATWKEVEDGTLKGFSGTYLSEKDAETLKESLTANKSAETFCNLIGADKRTLIAELENPVAVTISLVDKPCVANAIATSIKHADKAGRSISNSTFDKIKNIKDNIINSLADLDKLFEKAKGERETSTGPFGDVNKFYMEVDKMDDKEFNEKVGKVVDERLKPVLEGLDSIKSKLEIEDEPGGEPGGKPNPTSGKDDPKEDPPTGNEDPDDLEAIKAELADQKKSLKSLKEENEGLKKKLGQPAKSKGLDEPDDDDSTDGSYKGREDRDIFGCKIKD